MNLLSQGRLTKTKLINWINEQFIIFNITDYEVYKIEQTRYRTVDYEAGACQLQIRFKPVNEVETWDNTGSFMCFYRISDLEYYIKQGYSIHLSFKNCRLSSLSSLEIDVSSTKLIS
jgi:hypothetical protein